MRIEYISSNGDYVGPVLDIYFTNIDEAFDVGRIFGQLVDKGLCGWKGVNMIRIPLVPLNKKEEICQHQH